MESLPLEGRDTGSVADPVRCYSSMKRDVKRGFGHRVLRGFERLMMPAPMLAAGSASHRRPSRARPQRLDARRLPAVVRLLRDHLHEIEPPVVTLIAQQARDPFRVL